MAYFELYCARCDSCGKRVLLDRDDGIPSDWRQVGVMNDQPFVGDDFNDFHGDDTMDLCPKCEQHPRFRRAWRQVYESTGAGYLRDDERYWLVD